ncbi:MAG: chromosomal replication initiator protein DnaA, partial [Porticoccaceae bacterium]|nr:chromosomal replication initiator protein DnaA [Porticoccaceae bacterium]
MAQLLWDKCQGYLRDELPDQQFNTWIRPLQVEATACPKTIDTIRLMAPNRFVQDWVSDKFLDR